MKVKILLVVTNADLAGAPIHVRDLALRLQECGHKVHVVFGENGPIREQLQAKGIATDCVPTMRSNISPRQDIYSFLALSKIVRSVKPDLLHLHSSKAGLIGRLVAWRFKLPAVYTVHGWGFGSGRRKHVAFFAWFTELLCRHLTSRYIAVSNADCLMGLSQLKIQPSRIQTIYNGSRFTPEPSKTAEGRLVLIMVARNDHPKDYQTLFEALSRCNFDEALLVGNGTNTPEFIAQAKNTIGAKINKVAFLGARNDIEQLITKANVMVLSSHFEGLPISLIEGLSKGLVLLGSHVGGVPELIKHDVNGWLFDPRDSETLAKQINTLYQDPELLKRMGNASLQHFKTHFELDDMIQKTINQYCLACADASLS